MSDASTASRTVRAVAISVAAAGAASWVSSRLSPTSAPSSSSSSTFFASTSFSTSPSSTNSVVLSLAAALAASVLALTAFNLLGSFYEWARCFYYLGKIPHPKGGLASGVVARMLAPDHHRALRAWSRDHGGLFSMRLVHRRMLVASDARVVNQLFGAGEGLDKCLEPPLGNKMISQNGHDCLFTAGTKSAHWRLVRKGTAPAFVMKNIKGSFPGIVSIANQIGDALAESGSGYDVDINNMYMRFAMDITGVVGFAKDFGTSRVLADDATDGLFETLRDGMLELYKTATNPARPVMFWDSGVRKGSKAWAEYKKHMRELVKEVKARGAPRDDDESIAAHLLRLRDPSNGGAPLDDAALANEFGVYFAAGIESAGNAMTWTTYLISQHPEVEAKLVRELDDNGLLATEANPTPRPIEYADLAKLTYLSWVCKEAMRVRPVASSGTTRRVARDLVIRGYLVPKGSVVLCPFDSVHHLESNWGPDAAAFRPERWGEGVGVEYLPALSSEQSSKGGGGVSGIAGKVVSLEATSSNASSATPSLQGSPPPLNVDGDAYLRAQGDVADLEREKVKRFIPFSVGPRQCIGQSLARLMHDGGIAALYQRFSFKLAERAGGAEGVEREVVLRLTLQPGKGLWMNAVPRVAKDAAAPGPNAAAAVAFTSS